MWYEVNLHDINGKQGKEEEESKGKEEGKELKEGCLEAYNQHEK